MTNDMLVSVTGWSYIYTPMCRLKKQKAHLRIAHNELKKNSDVKSAFRQSVRDNRLEWSHLEDTTGWQK